MLSTARRLGAIGLAVVMLGAGTSGAALAKDRPHHPKCTGKSDTQQSFGAGAGRRNAEAGLTARTPPPTEARHVD